MINKDKKDKWGLNKMKKIYILIILFLFIPIHVYADSINLKCPNEVSTNSEIICELYGNSTAGITSLKASVVLSSNMSYISFIPNSTIFNGDGADKFISLYAGDVIKNEFKIGNIKLKINDTNSGKIDISSVAFYDESYELVDVASVTKTIAIKKTEQKNNNNNNNNSNNKTNTHNQNNSNNDSVEVPTDNNIQTIGDVSSNYLVDLKIEGYELSFLREQFDYSLEINNEDKLKIVPTLEDSGASYEILGNEKLKNGSVITIRVTSNDNKTNEYKINITKKENKQTVRKDYSLIFISMIIILIIINAIRFFMSKKKSEEKMYEQNK